MNYRKVYQKIINNARNEEKLGVRIRVSKYIVEWSKIINSPNYNKNSIKNINYKYVERKYKNSIYKYLEKIKLNPEWKYYERHHILPKSLFPLWSKRKSNIVLLTAREHFFCHQLLIKVYPIKQMVYAIWRMMNDKRINKEKIRISSKYYEKIKNEFSNLMSQRKGVYSPLYGKKISNEIKQKISKRVKEFMLNEGGNTNISKKLKTYFSDDNNRKNLSNKVKDFYKQNPEIMEYNKTVVKGKHLYTNGITNTFANNCPDGWWPSGNLNKTIIGSKWYNNGLINKRIKLNEEIPAGFIRGKIPYKRI